MLYYGTRHYGKVDRIPGLCHISTRFAHVQFIPLIPLGSYAVYEKSRFGEKGVRIGLHLKSVLMAWTRAFLMVSFVWFAGAGAARLLLAAPGSGIWNLAIASVAVLGYVYTVTSPRFRRATLVRARRIARTVGMSDGERKLIDAVYARSK